MRVSAAFPSKYIRAEDLQGRSHVLTMQTVIVEDVGTESAPEHKPVLYFRDRKKGLVLNKTNAQAISFYFGDETDEWLGNQIELYPDVVMFNNRQTPCIRVRKHMPPASGAGATGAGLASSSADSGTGGPPPGHPAGASFEDAGGPPPIYDDEIPF